MSVENVAPDDVTAVILAAGSGDRLSPDLPKQYIKLGDKSDPDRTVLDLVLDGYQRAEQAGRIIVVCSEDYRDVANAISGSYSKVKDVIVGGETRHDSAHLGAASVETKIMIIHDAARPLLYEPALNACLDKVRNGARAVASVARRYASMMVCREDGPVEGVIERHDIADQQCPVAYYTDDLLEAFRLASERGLEFRDEPALMRNMLPHIQIETVEAHRSGFKLTYPEDLEILNAYRRQLERESQSG